MQSGTAICARAINRSETGQAVAPVPLRDGYAYFRLAEAFCLARNSEGRQPIHFLKVVEKTKGF